jgi:hypothetical protein
MLKNWKTTLSGLVGAISSYVIFESALTDKPVYFKIAAFIFSGGLACLGINAQDVRPFAGVKNAKRTD